MSTATRSHPAQRRALPAIPAEPMLATLIDAPFDHPEWIFEPKFDGLRVLARFDGRTVSLVSRNGKPQEFMFPEIAAALRAALKRPAVVDGEVVCFDHRGRTSFRALQQRFHLTHAAEIKARADQYPAYIYVFDLLALGPRDMTGEPLAERKRLLRRTVRWTDRVRWTPPTKAHGKKPYRAACRRGDEGVIGKRLTSRYEFGRSPAWVKIKCVGRQEFVIGGFTDPQRSRVGLGALLVGYYDGGELHYAGKVGTGYTRQVLLDLRKRLDCIEQASPPFVGDDFPTGPGVH
jgi:DNA ligase D-like protein (predicted ligase)